MVWWAFILAGLSVIVFTFLYTEELKINYHESLPVALFVGGGLSLGMGILYYNAYTKNSLGLYVVGNFLRTVIEVILLRK